MHNIEMIHERLSVFMNDGSFFTDNKDAIIVRPSGNKANISWSPSIKDQDILSKQGITGKFVIQYDINRESNSGEVLVQFYI
jgi:hypothetical protein